MLFILCGVCTTTAAALIHPVTDGQLNLQELTEVPLMAAMFLAMAWQAERRQRAVEVAQRLAHSEHEARERERDFVRDASHEIRSPITLARGHVELLLRSGLDGQSAADAEVALAELDRLSRVSDALLTIARMEQQDELQPSAVDLAESLSRSVRRWSGVARRRWLLDVGTDVVARADPDRLEAAVDALLENAVQHTDEGGLISLCVRADGDLVVVEVGDDGPGVPPEHRERIFERFYRRSTGRNPSGSGLGLSIVQAVAVAHGGDVSVRPGPVGGAVFALRLPVAGPQLPTDLLAVG